MKTLRLLIAFALTTLLITCSKETPPDQEPDYIQFADEALQYLAIPPNSYFVYRDADTTALDSVVVQRCTLEKVYQEARVETQAGPFGQHEVTIPAFYYQCYSLDISRPGTPPPLYWLSGRVDNRNAYGLPTSDARTLFFWADEYYQDGGSNNLVFTYPFDPKYARVLPYLEVEGVTYKDVLQVRSVDEKTYHYWAKGVGIIRRVLYFPYKTQTTSLVRYGVRV